MRKLRFLALIVPALLAVSCRQKEIEQCRSVSISIGDIQLKTALNPERTLLQWSESDRISIYNDCDETIRTVEYSAGGDMTVPVPVDASYIKAAFPATSGTFAEPDFSFPLKQTQTAAGVLNGANYPLVAEAPIANDAAALQFSAVGSAFAMNVFNPGCKGELLQKVSVRPSQKTAAVQVSLDEPFAVTADAPTEKRTYGNQVYACLEKGQYNNVEFVVRTDRLQYTIISDKTTMDLENHDFFVVNLDLARLKVSIEVKDEEFPFDSLDVTLPSAGFVELVENLPEEQIACDTIPDFSTVGYHWGEDGFPSYGTVVQLPSPSGGDDTAVIQNAIDKASEGTVIQFQPGRYIVDGMIVVDKSGIVLRGSGNRETEIFARGTIALDGVDPTATGTYYSTVRDLINIGLCGSSGRTAQRTQSIGAMTAYNLAGTLLENHPDAWTIHGPGFNSDSPDVILSGSEIIEDAFCGSWFVTVKDASSFNVGDKVVIYRPGTDNWIHDLKMDNIIKALNDVGKIYQWKGQSYTICWERTVKTVYGDRIYFDAPLVMSVTGDYGRGSVLHFSKQRIKECGVENLRLVSDFNPDRDTPNYGRGDVYHALDAICFYAAEHCWVDNVETHCFSGAAVSMNSGSKNITVQNCDQKEPVGYIYGGLRYAFHISNGQMCLVKDCTSDDDRHQFVTGTMMPGPNAFVRCTATNAHANVGPHQRWATGTLYDNVSTNKTITAVDAGNSGTGQGWQGSNQVFWNCTAAAFYLQNPWVTGKNYAIGCKFIGGAPATLSTYNPYANPGYAPDGTVVYDSEVNGTREKGVCREFAPDEEESLYESQLKARLAAGDRVSNYVVL